MSDDTVRSLLMEEIADGTTLNSLYEIEDVLLLIGEMNKKVDFYKALKKRRTESIDAQVSNLNSRTAALRGVIYNTMKLLAPDEKTVNFPSIGKVSRRKSKDAWSVSDEPVMLSFLDDKGEKNNVIKVTEAVDKRKLNTLLNGLKASGVRVPGVEIVEGRESLSVTFEKQQDVSPRTPAYIADIDLDELDSLV